MDSIYAHGFLRVEAQFTAGRDAVIREVALFGGPGPFGAPTDAEAEVWLRELSDYIPQS